MQRYEEEEEEKKSQKRNPAPPQAPGGDITAGSQPRRSDGTPMTRVKSGVIRTFTPVALTSV